MFRCVWPGSGCIPFRDPVRRIDVGDEDFVDYVSARLKGWHQVAYALCGLDLRLRLT